MEGPKRRNPHPVTFKYRVERSNIFGSIKRPVAKIYLRSQEGEWLPCFMYIDSGADFTLIPYKLGLSLGFEMEREVREVYGVGGGIPIVVKSMEMKLGDMPMNVRVGWALREEIPIILGRLDVFDKFDIEFKEAKGEVVFKPVS